MTPEQEARRHHALFLREREGLKYRDIAERLGVTLERARQLLLGSVRVQRRDWYRSGKIGPEPYPDFLERKF